MHAYVIEFLTLQIVSFLLKRAYTEDWKISNRCCHLQPQVLRLFFSYDYYICLVMIEPPITISVNCSYDYYICLNCI